MKKKSNWIVWLLLLAMTAGLVLTGCSKDESIDPNALQPGEAVEEPAESAEAGEEGGQAAETPAQPVVVEPAKPKPVYYANPLSGERTMSDLSGKRPYAVMINNKREALPQLGVSQADIIYEVCAEGGITRMEALFATMEGVGNIGSIRSIRPYYIELATGYDAIIIHAGGSEEAYYDLSAWNLTHFDGVRGGYDASIFWRDAWRMANRGYEHSMLTSGENILNFVEGNRYRLEHEEGYQAPLKFNNENPAKFGTDAQSVTVRFSNYKTDVFTYDPETKLYMIEGHGQEYIDGNTEQQVGVTNVLVLNTTSQVLDNVGRLRVATTGEHSGTYFCGGKAVDITWSRDTRNDAFTYKLANGWDLRWMPGKTYICLINPNVSSMGYE